MQQRTRAVRVRVETISRGTRDGGQKADVGGRGDPSLSHGGHGRAETGFPVVAAQGPCPGIVHSADAVGARARFSSEHPGRETQPPLPRRAEANSPTMPGIVSSHMKPLFVVCRPNVIYGVRPVGSDDSHGPAKPRSPGCDFIKGKRLRTESSQHAGDLVGGSRELQQSALCRPSLALPRGRCVSAPRLGLEPQVWSVPRLRSPARSRLPALAPAPAHALPSSGTPAAL